MDAFEDLNAAGHFLQTIGPQIGQGQVIPKPSDDEIEWRGTSYNLPCRIKLDAFRDVEIAVKLQNPHGTCDLEWDAEKAPDPQAVDPWDDSDTVRVFVGRCTYIEGFADSIDEELTVFNSLPPDLTTPIIQSMQRDGIRYFRMRDSEVTADFRDNLNELQDPAQKVTTLAQLVGWAAAFLVGTPPKAGAAQAGMPMQPGMPAPAAAPAVHKVTCRYCRSLYLWGPTQQCTNCGAPAQG